MSILEKNYFYLINYKTNTKLIFVHHCKTFQNVHGESFKVTSGVLITVNFKFKFKFALF